MVLDFLGFPFEILCAVLIVARKNTVKRGAKPKIIASLIYLGVLAVYLSIEILLGKFFLGSEEAYLLFLPVMCVVYCIFALSLTFMLCQLYDVPWIVSFVTMAMGYGLQHMGFAVESSALALISAPETVELIIRVLIFGVIYGAAYKWLVPRFDIRIESVKKSQRWVWLSVFVLFCAIVFNMVLSLDERLYVIPLSTQIAFRMLDFLCTLLGMSVLLLVSTQDKLMSELDMLTHLNEAKMRHYDMSRENMELVNAKFHDVRKGLAQLRSTMQKMEHTGKSESLDMNSQPPMNSMQELENAIHIYDSIYQTGNDLIDALLTEKSLYCVAHDIVLNAIVDGKSLDFLEPSEISALLGNVLDNAIEASEDVQLSDTQRVIELNCHRAGGYAVIESSNFFAHEVTISPDTGLPVTSKKDKRFHGYGMKSIEMTTHERGGKVVVHVDEQDKIFEIRIVIPTPHGEVE